MKDQDFETVGDSADWGDDENVSAEEVETVAEAEAAPEPEPDDETGVEIEKNVPVPSNQRRKYPFHKMKPGDSFEVKTDHKDVAELGKSGAMAKLRSSLSSSAASFSRRHPKVKMIVRKTGPRTLRCWCVDNEEA